MREQDITRVIVEEHTSRFLESLDSDVIIVGAGPAGLSCAYYVGTAGLQATVLEREPSIGGGVWGGGTGYNIAVFRDAEILDELGVRHGVRRDLLTVSAIELAAALTYRAEQAGARIFNLTDVEDIVVRERAVCGAVVNSTAIRVARLRTAPVCIGARKVVDATGRGAELVNMLRQKLPDFYPGGIGEGFMNVEEAERLVVEKTGEVYPGLLVAGRSVCAVHGLPLMGAIFDGLLNSGRKAAEMVRSELTPQ